MSSQPDISVVIPTFRRPAELAETIGSVLRQSGVEKEIIVVDDSPEGSAEPVVAGFPDQPITYLRMEPPSGGRPAKVRNRGWQKARGALVHFLDDDDRVAEGHYAAAATIFRNSAIKVAFGRIEPFGPAEADVARETLYFHGATRRARRCGLLGATLGYSAAQFFRPALLVCSAGIIRRECLPVLGGFDEELPLVEDVDFYARAARRFGLHFMDHVALHYRIGPSLMHGPDREAPINASYRRMHARYRAEWGALDFYSLKLFSHLTANWLC